MMVRIKYDRDIMIFCLLEHCSLEVSHPCLLPLQQTLKLKVGLPSVQEYDLVVVMNMFLKETMMIVMMVSQCFDSKWGQRAATDGCEYEEGFPR